MTFDSTKDYTDKVKMFDCPVLTAINAVMNEIGVVRKDGTNEFHRYSYATIADVVAAAAPLMGKHGLVPIQSEEKTALIDNGDVLSITYGFHLMHAPSGRCLMTENENGDAVPLVIRQTGLSSARNKQGGFDDKASNKCHTAARKYFLIALFQIVTRDIADADSEEDRPKAAGARARRAEATVETVATTPAQQPPPDVKGPPRAIPLVGNPTAWCGAFVGAINAADNKGDVELWIKLNQGTISTFENDAPNINKRLQTRISEALKRFAPPDLVPIEIETLFASCRTQRALDNVWMTAVAGKFEDEVLEAITLRFQQHEQRVNAKAA